MIVKSRINFALIFIKGNYLEIFLDNYMII